MHWKAIWRAAWQRRDFWLRFAGLLLFAVGLSTFAATTQSVEFSVRTSISEHWRGAYDLLIRPPQAVLPTEAETGLVEGNYLGVPQGGITLEQYQKIAAMPQVEVAAPVATLGYLLNTTGQISFELPPAEPDALYHLTVELSGSAKEFRRRWENFFMLGPERNGVRMTQFAGDIPTTTIEGGFLSFNLGELPMQWTLLAGIDPEQEARLVGLPDTLTAGNYLPLQPGLKSSISYNGPQPQKVPEIPIIISQNAFLGDAVVTARVEAVPAPGFQLSEDLDAARRLLQSGERTILLEQSLPLEGNLAPLSGHSLLFSSEEAPKVSEEGFYHSTNFGVLLYPGGLDYAPLEILPAAADYAHGFRVHPLGVWGEMVMPRLEAVRGYSDADAPDFNANLVTVPSDALIFRPLEPRALPPFAFKVYGRYDFIRLAAPQDPLAYVPLGIYEPPLGLIRYDENGLPLPEERTYTLDLNPGGFIPRPPLALTTLDAIQYLTGRDDFIDAIRVRVAGVDSYTPENLAKVESLAAQIVEQTGLHVDVVAGSSPQKVLVYVPGVGYVEEPWTTLGAAVQVSQGVTTANALLLGAFLLASLLFIAETSQVSLLGRYREIGTLRAVGWSAGQTLRYLLLDALVMAVLAGTLGALAALVLNTAAGLQITGDILGGVFLLGVGAYLAGAIFPAWQVTRRWPVDLLQQGEMDFISAPPRATRSLHLAWLAWRQVWMRRSRFLLTAFIIALGIALSVFLAGVLFTLRGRLEITLLGAFISMHVRSYHVLMALIVLGMSFLAVLGNLLLSVNERASEFALLRAVGWHRAHLHRLVIFESLWNVLAGTLPGVGFSLWALQKVVPEARSTLPGLFLATVSFAVVLSLLAAWYPLRQLTRMLPAQVLSAEGRRLDGEKETAQGRILFVGLGVTAALLLTMLLGGRRDLLTTNTTSLTPTPTVPAVQLNAPLDEAMRHLTALADLGPRDAAHIEAQQAAADYIAETLQSFGWQVERQPIPLLALDLNGPGGSLQWPDITATITASATHKSALRPGEPLSAPLFWWSTGEPIPDADAFRGRIVLLLDQGGSQPLGAVLHDFVRQTDAAAAAAILEVRLSPEADLQALRDELQLQEGRLYVGENISAYLPGATDAAPLWLVAPYATQMNSPGANTGASGSAALLAWAERLAQEPPSRPVRLLFLGGETRSFSAGDVAALQASKTEQPIAVLYFDALGVWDELVYASRLDAPDAENTLSEDERAQILEQGNAFLASLTLLQLDLDTPDLAAMLDAWEARERYGLGQSPDLLVQYATAAAAQSGVTVAPRYLSACDSVMLFLSADYSALGVCGAGDSLQGSYFDTPDRIERQAYRQALGFGYQLIQTLLESELP